MRKYLSVIFIFTMVVGCNPFGDKTIINPIGQYDYCIHVSGLKNFIDGKDTVTLSMNIDDHQLISQSNKFSTSILDDDIFDCFVSKYTYGGKDSIANAYISVHIDEDEIFNNNYKVNLYSDTAQSIRIRLEDF